MKVILLRDMPGVGQKGSVKDVADGYALNMLLPKKLAEPATPEKLAVHTEAQAKARAHREAEDSTGRALKKKIEGIMINLNAPGNAQGHLYQKVSSEEIAAMLALQAGITVEAKNVHPKMPIKQTGEWPVEVRLGEHVATFIVAITAT